MCYHFKHLELFNTKYLYGFLKKKKKLKNTIKRKKERRKENAKFTNVL